MTSLYHSMLFILMYFRFTLVFSLIYGMSILVKVMENIVNDLTVGPAAVVSPGLPDMMFPSTASWSEHSRSTAHTRSTDTALSVTLITLPLTPQTKQSTAFYFLFILHTTRSELLPESATRLSVSMVARFSTSARCYVARARGGGCLDYVIILFLNNSLEILIWFILLLYYYS